jgi:DNA-binding GntR family transcriptional regulator
LRRGYCGLLRKAESGLERALTLGWPRENKPFDPELLDEQCISGRAAMAITCDAVYAELEREIIVGRLKPRERLLEAALCRRLGVSRTLLREVFRRLVGAGLVILQPNRGCTVRDYTPQEIEDLYYLRTALEQSAVPLIIRRLQAKDLKELKAIQREFEVACRRQDMAGMILVNLAFHRRLDEVSGNSFLCQVLETSHMQTQQIRYMVWMSASRIQQSVQEHRTILAALARRDAAAFKRAILTHLAGFKRDYLRMYPGDGDGVRAEQNDRDRPTRRRARPRQDEEGIAWEVEGAVSRRL